MSNDGFATGYLAGASTEAIHASRQIEAAHASGRSAGYEAGSSDVGVAFATVFGEWRTEQDADLAGLQAVRTALVDALRQVAPAHPLLDKANRNVIWQRARDAHMKQAADAHRVFARLREIVPAAVPPEQFAIHLQAATHGYRQVAGALWNLIKKKDPDNPALNSGWLSAQSQPVRDAERRRFGDVPAHQATQVDLAVEMEGARADVESLRRVWRKLSFFGPLTSEKRVTDAVNEAFRKERDRLKKAASACQS